jgi:hypothetical protein
MAISAYPLEWPAGWPRCKLRKYATFSKKRQGAYGSESLTIAQGLERALDELRIMGISRDDVVISSNAPLRLDGLPRGDAPNPADPGVALYWNTRKGETKVMAIDIYNRLADNLAAIAATLDAMRAIERHGGAVILDRAFAGFAALPPPGQTHARGWPEILGVMPMEKDLAKVQEKYRRLAAVHHPDRGGDQAVMAELNWAWAQAQEALR